MHLTYAKMGITQGDFRFDLVRRGKDDDDFSSQLLIDISIKLLKYKKKDLRVFLNELSHENLFMFMFSGWNCLLCELNEGGE